MLISFEGIDGSGKSTQIALLEEYLIEKGLNVCVYREPGGVQISEKIRDLLLNSKVDIHPVSEMLLFSAARAQLVAEKVIPDLKAGKVVILDRFYDSTTAYQGYGRGNLSLNYIHDINKIASLNCEPDITIYLKLTWEESKLRTAHKQEDRMEKAGEEFFNRVIQGFDYLANKHSRFAVIDADSSVNKIHQEIIKNVEVLL